ncbi:hypothetical protein [Candidatus Vidania fulgoroideorum]
MIRLGVKSGRIFEIFRKRFTYLSEDFKNVSRKMIFYIGSISLMILKINDSDLDFYFNSQSLDFAIIGSDFYFEKNLKFKYIKIDMFTCRLSLISSGLFNCKTNYICTKYKNIVSSFGCFNGFTIQKVFGSIETCLKIGLCDYIIDIVDTGKTLEANNLKEVYILKYIYSLLVMNSNVSLCKLYNIKTILHIL